MSLPLTIETLKHHNVISPGNIDIEMLYTNALDHLNLTGADYLTIRDLLQFINQPEIDVHALLLCMFASLNDGSVCIHINPSNLNRHLCRFLKNETVIDRLVQDIISCLKNKKTAPVIGQSVKEFKPLIQANDSLLYFQKYYSAEYRLGQLLSSIIDSDSTITPITDGNLNEILIDSFETQPIGSGHGQIRYNDDQILALIAVLLKRFVIISGGPGTGKTSLIIAIVRMFIRTGIFADRIKLAAPTGRAAQRLTESIHALNFSQGSKNEIDDSLKSMDATTIHHLLGYKKSRNSFTCNDHNLLPADVVIVDEVSMVDIVLMTKLLQAIPKECHIIFLGDRNQLPSVEVGSVLANLIPVSLPGYSIEFRETVKSIRPEINLPALSAQDNNQLCDKVVFLSKNYRSEPSIIQITDTINSLSNENPGIDTASRAAEIIHDLPQLNIKQMTHSSQFPKTGCWQFIPGTTSDKLIWIEIIQTWGKSQYLMRRDNHGNTYKDCIQKVQGREIQSEVHSDDKNETFDAIFKFISQARILTLIHAGLLGTQGINEILINQLRPEFDTPGNNAIFHGSPILITRNDKISGLFNGDIGVILTDAERGFNGVFQRSGNYISIPVNELPPYESSFAMTVHKSQGSEYDDVLLVLPDNPNHRLLTREIIYTGLTRAKNLAVIYGSKETLQTAITIQIHRESGLDIWNFHEIQGESLHRQNV